jgi:hypothetical protein
LSSTNHLGTLIAKKAMHKECFGCSGIGFVAFSGLFFEFLTPLYFGGCNFLNSNPFLTIFSALNVPKKRASSFVNTRKTMKLSPWIRPALSA